MLTPLQIIRCLHTNSFNPLKRKYYYINIIKTLGLQMERLRKSEWSLCQRTKWQVCWFGILICFLHHIFFTSHFFPSHNNVQDLHPYLKWIFDYNCVFLIGLGSFGSVLNRIKQGRISLQFGSVWIFGLIGFVRSTYTPIRKHFFQKKSIRKHFPNTNLGINKDFTGYIKDKKLRHK